MGETDIGKRLVDLRTIKDVSQDAVAEACNISRVALSRYENGTRMPRIEITSRLAEYYGVSVDFLIGKEEQELQPVRLTESASPFGPETQKIMDELVAKLRSMPESKQEEAARGALTFVRGVVSAEGQEGKA